MSAAQRICVLGDGSFGTALGCVLARNGHDVVLLSRSKQVPAIVNEQHFNPRHFPDVVLPDSLTCTNDPKVAFEGANYVLHAIPVQHSADYLRKLSSYLNPSLPLISCSKVST